jgi:phosphodiesterase/alkaline phosphatase D-like protein
MPRTLAAAGAGLTLLVLAPSAYAANGFSFGVTAGEITPRSAILWAKADIAGTYGLEVADKRGFRRGGVGAFLLKARAADDFTLQRKVRGLKPGSRYFYRFVGRRGRRSDRGTFVTAPRPKTNATVEFAWTGDTDFSAEPGEKRPFWNSGQIFRRMLTERNDFNIHLGDTIYSDSEIPSVLFPIALSVEQKWAKYKTNLANRHLRKVRQAAGFYSHWDDHEFINDFSPAESSFSTDGNNVNIDGRTLYRAGVKAFRDYTPITYSRARGIYRSFRWGRNLELFFLDERSFRDAKADEGGVCNNALTGQPDLAPTTPQNVRDFFSARVPSLAEPVSQQCLEAVRDPDRDFLGDAQYKRFTTAIRKSKARFKVVVNETGIQQNYVLPYDRWEGYAAERRRLLSFLSRKVENVVFLTTDDHATLVNDARLQTLEPGGPKNSGILDVIVGPAATANYGLEIDTATGSPGTGALVDTVAFESPPPTGVGMRCSIVDQFSYGHVKVTSKRLTVTPKGIDGKRQRNGDKPCGPFVLKFRR